MIGYYFYAKNVGVNIDPTIIPDGNTFYQEVEKALKSDSLSRKIDVLLISNLKDFTNVQDILERQKRYIGILLFSLTIILIAFFVLKTFSNLYPLALYSFGRQKEFLTKLRRKRDIWEVGVLLAFIVNIIAGLVIAFL